MGLKLNYTFRASHVIFLRVEKWWDYIYCLVADLIHWFLTPGGFSVMRWLLSSLFQESLLIKGMLGFPVCYCDKVP